MAHQLFVWSFLTFISWEIGSDTLCETICMNFCMKCQILFSSENKRNFVTNLSSAGSAHSVVSVAESSGACFRFNGTGRVTFQDNIDISRTAHFRLKFKTEFDSGVLYYAEGNYQRESVYDFEGLFLRDGYLHYFLFNPGDYGTGSSFGFHGKSKKKLNDNKWHTVEFYRNREAEVTVGNRKQSVWETGLDVDNKVQSMDERWRDGVNIIQPIVLGEDPHLEEGASSSLGRFRGRIKDIHEVTHGHDLVQEAENTGVRHCLNVPNAV